MTTNEKDALAKFYHHLELREGKRKIVYKDSLGKPTVGVGHLVLPEDHLNVGDEISEAEIQSFLKKDSAKAWAAAKAQAKELGKAEDWDFVIALGSVNFQLGTAWNKTFKNTYAALLRGDYETAIKGVKSSIWARQTPVRTADFVAAIEEAYKV